MNTIQNGGLYFSGGEWFLLKKGTFWMKIWDIFIFSGLSLDRSQTGPDIDPTSDEHLIFRQF